MEEFIKFKAENHVGDIISLNLDCRVNRGYLRAERKNVVFISAEVGVEEALREAGRLHVCLAIDCSPSMEADGKIETAKDAAGRIIDQLRPTDYVSVVRFARTAGVVIPRQTPENKDEIKKKIRKMKIGTLTNLYGGIELGYKELAGEAPPGALCTSRLIVLTDGIPTEEPTDEESFVNLSKDVRDGGISITALGIGEEYNEDLLIAIATASDGRWYHITDVNQLPGLFEEEISDMKTVVLVRPMLHARLLSGAELSNIYRIGAMATEVTDYQKADGEYIMPLEDVRAESTSRIVFKVHVPPKPEGEWRIAKLTLTAPGTELTRDVVVESTQDQSRWGVETDPYPRTLLTLAQATVVARQAVSDPTQVKKAQDLVETVMKDPAAAAEARKDPSLMGLGSTVMRVTDTVAKGKLTEEDKKKLKQQTTVMK